MTSKSIAPLVIVLLLGPIADASTHGKKAVSTLHPGSVSGLSHDADHHDLLRRERLSGCLSDLVVLHCDT